MTLLILGFVLTAVFLFTLWRFLCILYLRAFIVKKLTASHRHLMQDRILAARLMIREKPAKGKGVLPGLELGLLETLADANTSRFLLLAMLPGLIVSAVIFMSTGSRLITVAALISIPLLILVRLKQLSKKKGRLFLSQIGDVINYLSSSIKSGYSLMQALTLIVEDGPEPASSEIKRVLQDINLGKTYEEAFGELVGRNPHEDVEILVTAILISKETGSNLAIILDTVSHTIREREKLDGEVRSITAQGRLSGLILTLLPIGVFALLYVLNPAYIKPLFDQPSGRFLLVGGICSQIFGALMIKNIIKIDW